MSFLDVLKSVFPASTAGPVAAEGGQSHTGRAKVWPLSPQMREEMKKGIVLHMKIILRGMRGVGKSCLLARLTGEIPPVAYIPSSEISASSIRIVGAGCALHEGTKVDIWDVVDEGRATGSALMPRDQAHNVVDAATTMVADARSIDVYKDCHLVAFVVDCTRYETLEYAVRQAQHVPPTACILFVLNRCDEPLSRHRVSVATVQEACRRLRRANSAFISAALEGRPAPLALSVEASYVAVSALTGQGMPQLVAALDVPNTFLRIAEVEGRLARLYRHLSWPRVAARAALNVNADGSVNGAAAASLSPVVPVSSAPSVVIARALAGSRENHNAGALLLAHAPLARASGTSAAPVVAVDKNGITTGFFDDVEGEEESISSGEEGTEEEDEVGERGSKGTAGGGVVSSQGKCRRGGAVLLRSLPHADSSLRATVPSMPDPLRNEGQHQEQKQQKPQTSECGASLTEATPPATLTVNDAQVRESDFFSSDADHDSDEGDDGGSTEAHSEPTSSPLPSAPRSFAASCLATRRVTGSRAVEGRTTTATSTSASVQPSVDVANLVAEMTRALSQYTEVVAEASTSLAAKNERKELRMAGHSHKNHERDATRRKEKKVKSSKSRRSPENDGNGYGADSSEDGTFDVLPAA